VLVAEDEKPARFLIGHVLTDAGFQVAMATDGASAIQLAKTLPVDVILLDYRLPDMTGHDVLIALNQDPELAAVPVLMVTADDRKAVITKGLELGATDFVLKPFEPVELIARIQLAQRTRADREGLRLRNEQLERAGSLDPLTGIPNRAHLDKELVRLASHARRRRSPLAVLVLDVDLFKEINDHHGHSAGDTALRALAVLLVDAVRAEDVVGRVGGDEFLVLLPDTDAEGARELAERIRARVGAHAVDGPDETLRITVSIGCAAGVTVDPGELVRSADSALYEAKASGRNQVSVASAQMRDKLGAITTLIVDDHRMVAESMARLVEREEDLLVAGVVTTAAAALDATRLAVPDVVLLDHHLPDNDGVSTARALRQIAPDVRVILVTGDGSDEVLLDAIDAGCSGYIDKSRASHELVSAIRLAHRGEIVMAPAEVRRLVPRLSPPGPQSRDIFLTVNEREILSLAAEGLDNGQIAERLGLRANEIHRDVQSLLARLDVRSKLEAIATASRSGLIETRPQG